MTIVTDDSTTSIWWDFIEPTICQPTHNVKHSVSPISIIRGPRYSSYAHQ